MLGVAAVLAVQVAVSIWLLRRSWFFSEDFTFLEVNRGLPISVDLLTYPTFGHLVPGFLLANKWLGELFGASWLAASVVTLVIQAGGVVAFARLVVALRGLRWWVPCLTAVWALGVITLNNTPWWAATTTMQATVVLSMATFGSALRFDATRRWRHLLSAGACFVLALAFFEKSLAVTAYVGLFVLLVGTPASPGPRWGDRVRQALRLWPLWVVLALVAVADLAVYVSGPYLDSAGEPASAGVTAEYVVRSLVQGLFPSLIGAVNPTSLLPGPPLATFAAATLLLGGLVVWTAARSRLALRAWGWFAVCFLLGQLLTARGRLGVIELDVVVQNLRYQVDAAYLFLVALAVALPAAAATLAPATRRRLATGLLVLAVAATPLWWQSVRAIADNSPGPVSRAYFAGFREQPPTEPVLDLTVPGWVVPPEMYPWNTTSRVLPVIRPGTATTTDPGRSSMIRYDGSIVPTQLLDLTTPDPGETCVARRDGATPVLELDDVPPTPTGAQPLVAFDLPRGRPATVTVTATTPGGEVEVRGLGTPVEVDEETTGVALVVAPAEWSAISLTVTGRTRLCISNVRLAVPAG